MKLKMKPHQYHSWRKVNTAVMFFAMIIPWYDPGRGVEGEISPDFFTFSLRFQWMSFIRHITDSVFVRISHGIIDDFTIELILHGAGALLLVLYLAYNLLVLLKKKKEYKSRIVIPVILISIFYAFLLWLMSGFLPTNWKWIGLKPMLGFWLISLSLLSSAALEWVNARQV